MDIEVFKRIAPTAVNSLQRAVIFGVGGKESDGILYTIPRFSVFGTNIEDFEVLFSDFSHWHQYEIAGLLGFDLIKRFHHEMDGLTGVLKIIKWHPI